MHATPVWNTNEPTDWISTNQPLPYLRLRSPSSSVPFNCPDHRDSRVSFCFANRLTWTLLRFASLYAQRPSRSPACDRDRSTVSFPVLRSSKYTVPLRYLVGKLLVFPPPIIPGLDYCIKFHTVRQYVILTMGSVNAEGWDRQDGRDVYTAEDKTP